MFKCYRHLFDVKEIQNRDGFMIKQQNLNAFRLRDTFPAHAVVDKISVDGWYLHFEIIAPGKNTIIAGLKPGKAQNDEKIVRLVILLLYMVY